MQDTARHPVELKRLFRGQRRWCCRVLQRVAVRCSALRRIRRPYFKHLIRGQRRKRGRAHERWRRDFTRTGYLTHARSQIHCITVDAEKLLDTSQHNAGHWPRTDAQLQGKGAGIYILRQIALRFPSRTSRWIPARPASF